MRTYELQDWNEWHRDVVAPWTQLQRSRRRQLVFRGQSDADWELQSTLDRVQRFESDSERADCLDDLLLAFRRHARGLAAFEGFQTEFIARHHGLPTTVLDWTEAPHIAAFFAFADSKDPPSGKVAIYAMDRLALRDEGAEIIDILDEDLPTSDRVTEQKAVFVRVKSAERSLVDALGSSLVKFTLPWSERTRALIDLDAAKVNHRDLFRDLDGAARSAWIEVLELGDRP